MVKMLDYDKGSSPGFADFIRDQLRADPAASGFKRLSGSVISLDYEMELGKNRLRVGCRVKASDGKRWLLLQIEKHPEPPTFHDITFVRRAFLGGEVPALIYYGTYDGLQPISNSGVDLWMPIDAVWLPDGKFERPAS